MVNHLFLIIGLAKPSEQEACWGMEAVRYANPDLFNEDKKLFEVKSLSYFMSRKNAFQSINKGLISFIRP